MTVAFVRSSEGDIPVQILDRGPTRLIECRQAAAFLRHIGAIGVEARLPADAYVRAVVTPGEGAWVELFDALGSLVREPWQIGAEDAARLFGSTWA